MGITICVLTNLGLGDQLHKGAVLADVQCHPAGCSQIEQQTSHGGGQNAETAQDKRSGRFENASSVRVIGAPWPIVIVSVVRPIA